MHGTAAGLLFRRVNPPQTQTPNPNKLIQNVSQRILVPRERTFWFPERDRFRDGVQYIAARPCKILQWMDISLLNLERWCFSMFVQHYLPSIARVIYSFTRYSLLQHLTLNTCNYAYSDQNVSTNIIVSISTVKIEASIYVPLYHFD